MAEFLQIILQIICKNRLKKERIVRFPNDSTTKTTEERQPIHSIYTLNP